MADYNQEQALKIKALELAQAVYRVAAKLPSGTALAWQMNQAAGQILLLLNTSRKRAIIKKIKGLVWLFQLAKTQNWLDQRNFQVLEQEYLKFAEIIRQKKGQAKQPEPLELTARQEKIIKLIQELQKAQLADLLKSLKISRSTIKRDIKVLIVKGLIGRSGRGISTYYWLK